MWYRSMRIALLGRNKLGLVDGSCPKERFPELGNHWERVNAIVLSWIMNSVSKGLLGGIMYASNAQSVWEELNERFHKVDGARTFNIYKEIATLSQGTTSVTVYYSSMKDLWEEFESLVPAPACNCEKSKEYVQHMQKLKLFQFLTGLNDSYIQATSQILLMNPMPSVNQAYSMIISDESKKTMSASSGILGSNPAVIQGSYDAVMYSRTVTSVNHHTKRNYNFVCDFCKIKGHTMDFCYKLVEYPQD